MSSSHTHTESALPITLAYPHREAIQNIQIYTSNLSTLRLVLSLPRQTRAITARATAASPQTRYFIAQTLDSINHEREELQLLLHLTSVGAPFEKDMRVKSQMEEGRRGLLMAMRRLRRLVNMETMAK